LTPNPAPFSDLLILLDSFDTKGSFTYYVISEGEGGFQMITLDYEGGGGFGLMIT
jgi:hypothetical protein